MFLLTITASGGSISNIAKVASGEALCQLAEEDKEKFDEEEEQEASISLSSHFLTEGVQEGSLSRVELC